MNVSCRSGILRVACLVGCLLAVPGLALAQTGGINGTVSGDGTALSGAAVYIYNSSESQVGGAVITDASGAFSVSSLPPGTYYAYVYTGNVTGGRYVDAVYPDSYCVGFPITGQGTYCRPNLGDPIVVTGGNTTSGIDFDVPIGGVIQGRVTAQGEAFQGTQVALHVEIGTSFTSVRLSTSTAATGTYAFNRLPPGDYFVAAGNVSGGAPSGYVTELYESVTCPLSALSSSIPTTGPGCSTEQGSAVAVTLGGTSTADIDLDRGGAVSGRVTALGAPMPSGTSPFVYVYSADGVRFIAGASPAATGAFLIRNLEPGDYRLYTVAFGYAPEVYDDVPCPNSFCSTAVIASGTPVGVTVGSVTGGLDVDLGLSELPTIVRSPASDVVLSGESTAVVVEARGAGTLTYQWYRGTTGDTSDPVTGATDRTYVTPPITTTSNYWVRVGNAAGSAFSSTATLTVASAGTGAISGVVASEGTPLENARVDVYNSSEQLVRSSVPTSASGAFAVAGLAPGTYRAFVFTGNVTGNFTNVLWPNTSCAFVTTGSGTSCRVSAGGPIVVVGDTVTPDADFDVPAGGLIGGVVTGEGVAFDATQVRLYVSVGAGVQQLQQTSTDADGRYQFRQLPAGDYLVWAGAALRGGETGFVDELYDDRVCPFGPGIGCSVTMDSLTEVAAGQSVEADFDMARAGAISGTVTASGIPRSGAQLLVYREDGGTAFAQTDLQGRFFIKGLAPGGYGLQTSASGVTSEVYDDIPCPVTGSGCGDALSLGRRIGVAGGSSTAGIDVDLTPPGAPVIVRQPQDQWVASFAVASLSVSVSGATPLTIQWYRGASGDTSSPISGAMSSNYSTRVTALAEGSYWARVTNGEGTVDSAAAQIGIGTPPVITTQPESPVIVSGQAVNLTVTATANTLVTYQWYQGPSGDAANPIPGATGSLFTTPSLSAATNYWVRASTSFGSVDSTTAAVTIGVAPTIVTQPEGQTVLAGESATLSVVAGGTPAFSYQWYEGASGSTAMPVSGATGSTFTTSVLGADTEYWVRVTSAYGSVDSASARVTVIPEVGRPQRLRVKARDGNLVTLVWTPGLGQQAVTDHVLEGGIYGQAATLAQLPTGSADATFALNVPPGTFWLQMRAVSGAQVGEPSEQIRLCVSTPCPADTPENLLGTANGSAIALAWRTPLESGVPSRVILQVSGSLSTSLDLPGTAESFTFPSVPNGDYEFRVSACTASGCSEPSEPVQLSFPAAACTGAPNAPAGFMVSRAGSRLVIDWELPESGSAPTGTVLNVESALFTGALPVSGRRFTTPSVPAGEYTFSVAGVNACGTGAATAPITVTIP